jgi:hypothetical protein
MGSMHEWQEAQAATSSILFNLCTDLECGVPNLEMASWKASRFGVRRSSSSRSTCSACSTCSTGDVPPPVVQPTEEVLSLPHALWDRTRSEWGFRYAGSH